VSTTAGPEGVPRFLADTNCLVALLAPWHEHHERVLREMERRLDAGATLVVAAPTLMETYAVLTRLPAPHRLAPADCRALIEATITSDTVEVVVSYSVLGQVVSGP